MSRDEDTLRRICGTWTQAQVDAYQARIAGIELRWNAAWDRDGNEQRWLAGLVRNNVRRLAQRIATLPITLHERPTPPGERNVPWL